MKLFRTIKKAWKNEAFAKIRRYMWGPTWICFVIADIAVFLTVIVLLLLGKLENMIVSMNIRYNSPVFKALIVILASVFVCSCTYGIILSLRTYKRTSKNGILKPSYKEGTSYRALSEWIDKKMFD